MVGRAKKQQKLFLHASHVNCIGQGLIKAHIHTQMGYIWSLGVKNDALGGTTRLNLTIARGINYTHTFTLTFMLKACPNPKI